jgi:UDP-perosamine 4-acetyltransferase
MPREDAIAMNLQQAPRIVLGAGRQAQHVLDLMAWMCLPWEPARLFDDAVRQRSLGPRGLPICGTLDEGAEECIRTGAPAMIALGSRFGALRASLFRKLSAAAVPLARLAHPSCLIAPEATLGANLLLMPGCVVATHATIGPLCCAFSNCTFEHDCRVGHNVVFGPGVVCSGDVAIGDHCFVGAGAVLLPGVRVGERALVGAGSVVTAAVPPDVVIAGVPARFLRVPRKGDDVPLAAELGI